MITQSNAVCWWLLLVVVFVLAVGVALYGFYPSFKRRDMESRQLPAGQLYELELGGHLTQVKDTLITMKKDFEKIAKDRKLSKLLLAVNDTEEFKYVKQHCPSIDTGYTGYLLSVGLLENGLKVLISNNASKEDIKEQRELIRSKICEFIGLIDKSILTNEYLKNQCYCCPIKPTISSIVQI